MGTHPIFESDFDCLTDMIRKAVSKSNFESYLQKAISVCSSVQPRFLDQNINNDPSLRTAAKHLQEALNYTLPGGKMTRGLITTRVFHSLADPDCYEWYELQTTSWISLQPGAGEHAGIKRQDFQQSTML